MDTPDKQQATEAELMRQLFAASFVSMMSSVILAAILAYAQLSVISPAMVWGWFLSLALISLLRGIFVRICQRNPGGDAATARRRLWLYRCFVLASGMAWGAAGWLLFPPTDQSHQMILVTILVGLASGGVVSMSADFVCTIGFPMAALLPLALRLFAAGNEFSFPVGIALTFYIFFITANARRIHYNILDNIILRLEAARKEVMVSASERRYRLLLDYSPFGIFHYDANLVITYCNNCLGEMLRTRGENLIGVNMKQLKDQSMLPALQQALEGKSGHFEGYYRATHSDAEGWMLMVCAPAPDDTGRNTGGIAIVQDISERRRAENELRIAATVFESSDGVMITDAEGTILRVNHAFTGITGFLPEDAVGRTPRFLHSGRQDKGFYETMWSQIVDRGSWSGELWNRRKDGHIYPEWLTITAVRDAHGAITNYVGIFSDVTEQKGVEAATLQAKIQAENLAQSKSEFLANMSHEIRTPMNAIIGLSHLALNQEVSVEVRDYLEKINVSSESLLGILNDILDFSKIEAGKLHIDHIPFSLHSVLDNMRNLFSVRARETARFPYSYRP